MPPNSATATKTSQQRSSDIFQKLLCVCYYYCRCFGTVSHCIKRCSKNNNNNCSSLQHYSNKGNSGGLNNNGSTTITIQTNRPQPQQQQQQLPQSQQNRFAFQACEQRPFTWLNIASHCICCTIFYYGSLQLWTTDDSFYTRLLIAQIVTITACPIITVFVQFWYRKRMILAMNALLRLMQCVEELNADHALFQWTHVALITLKMMSFVYEIVCAGFEMNRVISNGGPWFEVALMAIEMYLLIGMWLSLHVASLLYICIDALYGALNHYMRHEFLPRLRLNKTQSFGQTASSANVLNRFGQELAEFSDLFKRVHDVGLQLHYLWQIPVVTSILYVYCAIICVVYYLICLNVMLGETESRFFVFILKLVFDIVLLSLTGHRAVKRSQLIGYMGLGSVILTENVEWHRQMELLLNHINLYEFKLTILGLFDISNTLTLTFLSGILTSITIFIPFSITFLEGQN